MQRRGRYKKGKAKRVDRSKGTPERRGKNGKSKEKRGTLLRSRSFPLCVVRMLTFDTTASLSTKMRYTHFAGGNIIIAALVALIEKGPSNLDCIGDSS